MTDSNQLKKNQDVKPPPPPPAGDLLHLVSPISCLYVNSCELIQNADNHLSCKTFFNFSFHLKSNIKLKRIP